MTEKYICMKCKSAGAKNLIPYKIIQDNDVGGIKFIGQLCDHCFKEIFAPAPSILEKTDDKDKKIENNEN